MKHRQQKRNDQKPQKPQKLRSAKKERRLLGIRTQLYGAFLIPIILMIFLGIFIYNKSSDALVDNYKTATLNTFTAKAEYLDSFMQGIREKGVQLIVNETITDYYGKDYLNGSRKSDGVKLYKTVLKLVASVFGTSKDINAYYLFGEYGNAIESTTQVGVDYFNEYQETAECKKLQECGSNFLWTGYHQFLDEKVGISPESYAASMTLTSFSPKMYLICDVNMERMKEILNSLDLGKGSVVGFVSADGREILSDSESFAGSENVFTSLKEYTDAAATEKTEGFVEGVKLNGKKYCFVYSKIGETGAVFCGLVPEEVLLSAANSIRLITILIIAIAVVLAGAAGTIISLRISNTITRMSKGITKAAQGDLTVAFEANGSTEFKALAESMNVMLKNTKHLIDEASKAGDRIKESSVRVGDTMQSLAASTQEISQSFGEVEQGCTRQTEDVMQCADNMNELADEITIVNDKIDSLKRVSDEAGSAVTEGLSIVGELNEKMLATSNITETVVTDISELEENTRSVDEIVNVINGLSTQTNLLSLNASIEAARAGAAGRGFSVVAEEIRKLADETMSAGTNIQKLIQNIQDKTKATVGSTRQAGEIVRSQMESLDMTMQLFHRISNQVTQLTSQFESIIQQMVLMEDKKQSSMDKIENVAAVSQQSLALVENASTSATEQIATMRGLAEESRQLSDDIASLEEAISKFKVTK